MIVKACHGHFLRTATHCKGTTEYQQLIGLVNGVNFDVQKNDNSENPKKCCLAQK
jgi:hypothetical protein